MTWLLAQVREWHNNGLQARLVGPTQKTQRRKHQEYRNTKVAGCKLPDGALSVRDAWAGFLREPMICTSLYRFFTSNLLIKWDWNSNRPAIQNRLDIALCELYLAPPP
jgi:hypothetical protein